MMERAELPLVLTSDLQVLVQVLVLVLVRTRTSQKCLFHVFTQSKPVDHLDPGLNPDS